MGLGRRLIKQKGRPPLRRHGDRAIEHQGPCQPVRPGREHQRPVLVNQKLQVVAGPGLDLARLGPRSSQAQVAALSRKTHDKVLTVAAINLRVIVSWLSSR